MSTPDLDTYDCADEDDLPPQRRECKLCGKDNLLWESFEVNGRPVWRLVDPKTYLVHHCKVKTPEAFLNSKF